ncbi:UDP-N-acetylmuramoyl-L-alanyl-D-glutamate--2,6-diaminopimelate ligase [Marinomonas algicola]|uniref:UDP-N-acetylmuramoyl-L-alanyl-D-glutamate--2, 6-diaminopimelate ligase n=1 Tax=Marinomonas algicola TaxID=2773454 RepID=UPI00174E6A71|nr:UDP-N-acetylmuramoyl-L-alanyl-D-glutamate--2,6-diaminopimelate ligase [Marinomonas algicola]
MFTLLQLAKKTGLTVPTDLLGCVVDNVQTDSREVSSTSLFFALPGVVHNGWDYLHSVAKGGCKVAIVPDYLCSSLQASLADSPLILIPSADVVRSLSQCLNDFVCQYPDNIIAVTGTNGKSSISYYIAQLTRFLHFKSGIVGTFGVGSLDDLKEAKQTTPDQLMLHLTFDDFFKQGLQYVAFEASSHSLDQRRVDGIPFKCAVFSNLSRDHLDYHGSMEAYAEAKRKLLQYPNLERVVLNLDDDYCDFMSKEVVAPIYTYSIKNSSADFFASNLEYGANGTSFVLNTPNGAQTVFLPLLGRFNVENALASIAALWDEVPNVSLLLDAVESLQGAPGRMQKINVNGKPLVVVDYAHTPDALSSAISALKVHSNGRVFCVFGCGGDRDKGKRPLMTAAALKEADGVWLTSDNPRTENPNDILSDALNGVDLQVLKSRLWKHVDRHQAIIDAIHYSRPGDVVLIAGKGHETYQDVMGVKHFFDDVLEAQKALEHYAN